MLNTQRLRILRKEKNLIQQDIADLLGVGRTTYVKYETGDSEPPLESISKLAVYFQVSTDYLIGNTDDPTPTDKKKEPLSLEEIEALYMQSLIDNKIKSTDNPMTPDDRKRLEDSIRLAIRIAIESQGN